MGYMAHHAIVVTSWHEGRIIEAHGRAVSIGLRPTAVTDEAINGYRSFLIPPDGSKEGWDDSDAGDAKRDAFMDIIDKDFAYDDGSNSVEFVCVRFGGDETGEATVERENAPNKEE
jgi:hypothetical protein